MYTGSWGEGKKHGPGVYWDTSKGCLRGSWRKGTLVGTSTYDQPAIHYEGEFVAGVPGGPCSFTITSQRTLDLPKFAAAHIRDSGPTLRGPAQYGVPPGSGARAGCRGGTEWLTGADRLQQDIGGDKERKT